MATVLTESLKRAGCFIYSESQRTRARSAGTLIEAVGNALVAGTVLGQVSIGAGTSAVKASGANTGNGVMGAITVGAQAQTGVYTLRVTATASNAGAFVVKDPTGDVVGEGNVAAAFSGGGLSFTLADGATDFAVGDGFDITVALGSGKYTALALAGTAGEAVARAILFDTVDATEGDMPCVVLDSDFVAKPAELTWPAGITADQKAAALAQLLVHGIKMEPTY